MKNKESLFRDATPPQQAIGSYHSERSERSGGTGTGPSVVLPVVTGEGMNRLDFLPMLRFVNYL